MFVGLIYVFLIMRIICDNVNKPITEIGDEDDSINNEFYQYGKEGTLDVKSLEIKPIAQE
jgi:hypothetical protein